MGLGDQFTSKQEDANDPARELIQVGQIYGRTRIHELLEGRVVEEIKWFGQGSEPVSCLHPQHRYLGWLPYDYYSTILRPFCV